MHLSNSQVLQWPKQNCMLEQQSSPGLYTALTAMLRFGPRVQTFPSARQGIPVTALSSAGMTHIPSPDIHRSQVMDIPKVDVDLAERNVISKP